MALVVAELIYYLVTLYGDEPRWQRDIPSTGLQHSIEQIKAYPLFGRSEVVSDLSVAPPTKLHLELFSVAMHQDARQSSALIKVQSKPLSVFRVNDSLGRGIRIKKIEQARIVIERQGVLETLAFPAPRQNLISSSKVVVATSHNIVGTSGHNTEDAGFASITRDLAALTATSDLSSLTSLEPTQLVKLADQTPRLLDRLNINASGLYQPKTSKHVGKLIGLRDGDRIISVNDQPFGDLLSNPAALAAAATAGKIKLSVRRGSENIVITAALP